MKRGSGVGSVRPRAWTLTPGSVACLEAANPPFILMIHRSPLAHEADLKRRHFYCLCTCSTACLRPWRPERSVMCKSSGNTCCSVGLSRCCSAPCVCVYILMNIYIYIHPSISCGFQCYVYCNYNFYFLNVSKQIFIDSAVPGLSCGTRDLFLVTAYGI